MIVTATKNITYDVQTVRESIAELNSIPLSDVLEEEAIQMIWKFIAEDFGDTYGVVLLDEDGNEVQE